MNEPVDPRKNLLLSKLPDAEWEYWKSLLELVYLPVGKVLFESGDEIKFACFPTSGIVSMLYPASDGHTAKCALVGKEGVVGISIFLGGNIATSRAIVQSAGTGYLLRTDTLKGDFINGGPTMFLMLRYAQLLINQIRQSLMCNRIHQIGQQFCRLLLLSLDRQSSCELIIKEELIGKLLNVKRETVTDLAMQLQAAHIVEYSPGLINVVDRTKLQEKACGCYTSIIQENGNLTPS